MSLNLHIFVLVLVLVLKDLYRTMWRKASVVLLLALAVGYFYGGRPDLPDQILQYMGLPQLQNQDPDSLEETISAAWEVLITLPGRQWSRVAVG